MGEVCSNDRDSVSLRNIVVERRRILVNPGVSEGKKSQERENLWMNICHTSIVPTN